jgi:hypothetical protein
MCCPNNRERRAQQFNHRISLESRLNTDFDDEDGLRGPSVNGSSGSTSDSRNLPLPRLLSGVKRTESAR